MRVARHHILPVFNDIFHALIDLISDTDNNVCVGADMLDTTLKGIVQEKGEALNLDTIIPIIRAKIYTNNLREQMLLVSWITVLQGIPCMDLSSALSEILDGLMVILGSNNVEVSTLTENLLTSLLSNCRDNPEGVNCIDLTPLFIQHARSHNSLLKSMALLWLNDLLTIGGRVLLPHAAPILAAALPSVKSHAAAEEVSFKIMKLLDPVLDDKVESSPTEETEDITVNISSLVSELLKHLRGELEQCKFIALRWLLYLLKNFPKKMQSELNSLCKVLLPVLGDPSDNVVVLVLQLYACIARTPGLKDESTGTSPYFKSVMSIIVDNLKDKKAFLTGRAPLIFRELCVLLSPTEVYVVTSTLLEDPTLSPDFVSSMSSILATILITSSELLELRIELRKLNTKESCAVFVSLFKCWSHNPISVLLLCFISQAYEQSALLVQELSKVEVTVDFLVEVDKLVQLLECPIFTFLRLDLLRNDNCSSALVDTLYGLLMVLPQSKSYATLATRLNNLPPPHHTRTCSVEPLEPSMRNSIDFDALLNHFKAVQMQKRDAIRQSTYKKLEENSSIESLMAQASLNEQRSSPSKARKDKFKSIDMSY